MRDARHTGDFHAASERPVHAQTSAPITRPLCATVLLALACLVTACQRGIGDECETALNCSSSATRLCDQTQPHGYCTLAGCDVGTCPSDSVCVRFWPRVDRPADADRLGTNYCMRTCGKTSDCRDDQGYACLSASDFGAKQESLVLGNPNQRFCAVRSRPVMADAGSPDAGSPDASQDANQDANQDASMSARD